MANYVVWIDHDQAKLFELDVTHETLHTVLRTEDINHHKGIERERNKHKDLSKFFNDVTAQLETAHQVLLIGPGLAKTHFKEHLDSPHHEAIGKKVVGVETVDHPTDGQIVALAKTFFKAHLAFE